MKNVGLTLRVDAGRERRDGLDQAWYGVLLREGLRPVLLPNAPDPPGGVAGWLEALGVEAVILTGGNDLAAAPGGSKHAPERDALESELIDACRDADVPLLGVCRGLQHLVVHYGGRLSAVSDHVAKPHALVVEPGSLMPLTDRDAVNSFHDFGVRREDVGSELRVVATAPDGSVEAVAHTRHRQWGVMWHPERDPVDPRDGELIRALLGGHRRIDDDPGRGTRA